MLRLCLASTLRFFGQAAQSGDPEVLRLLLERGAEVNVHRKDNGRTPLMSAAALGNTDCTTTSTNLEQCLLDFFRVYPPLPAHPTRAMCSTLVLVLIRCWLVLAIRCCARFEASGIRCLLAAGADVAAVDEDGLDAASIAAAEGYPAAAAQLRDELRAKFQSAPNRSASAPAFTSAARSKAFSSPASLRKLGKLGVPPRASPTFGSGSPLGPP